MAPPRRGAVVDDSRSEASSGTREPKGKGRRGGNGAANRDAKGSSHAGGVTSAPGHGQHSDQAKVPWSDMPLEILHSYRHAYKLNTPSAFSNDYSHLLLSSGIGLRSPTSLAARRSQSSSSNQSHELNGSAVKNSQSLPPQKTNSNLNGVSGNGNQPTSAPSQTDQSSVDEKALHQVIGQGRVSKKQLAQTVRKHFSNSGLGEQEAIARFLYKVREEGRGHQFRLRFQP